ncbi:MAG: hypothetical protein LBB67_05755 [Oscillospiraceae bacterium]|nr:hypothetical protein [Oscillospiraceae bacterium]
MSRKVGVFLSAVAIFLFVLYVAHDFATTQQLSSLKDLLSSALDVPQKHLWNVTLCHMPILFFLKAPYLQPNYQVRLRPNVFSYILKRSVLISLCLSVYLFFLYVFYAFTAKMDLSDISFALSTFLRLIAFSFMCNLLYFVFYWLSKKEILAIMGVLLLNIIFLFIITEITFQFPKETMGKLNTNFMVAYSSTGNILGIFALWRMIQKREILD